MRMPAAASSSPAPTDVQKAVQRSSSEISLFWTRATPRPTSLNTTARPVNASAIPARPNSAGVSSRANAIATTVRDAWRATCATMFHLNPVRSRARIGWMATSDVTVCFEGTASRSSGPRPKNQGSRRPYYPNG